jgi:hypothetical protein
MGQRREERGLLMRPRAAEAGAMGEALRAAGYS